MTPDIDPWLWALPSGQLEWRPVQFSRRYNVNCVCTHNVLYFKSWIIKKTHLCDLRVREFCCYMHDLLYESLFHPLLIHPPVSSCTRTTLCPAVPSFPFPTFFDSLLHHFFSFSDLSGVLGQIARLLYSYASVCMLPCLIKTAKRWIGVVHLGSVWPNLPLKEPLDSSFHLLRKTCPTGSMLDYLCWGWSDS